MSSDAIAVLVLLALAVVPFVAGIGVPWLLAWPTRRRDARDLALDSLPQPEWVRPIEAPPGDASCCPGVIRGVHFASCPRSRWQGFEGRGRN